MATKRRGFIPIIGFLVIAFLGLFVLPALGHSIEAGIKCRNECDEKYMNEPEGVLKWYEVGYCKVGCWL